MKEFWITFSLALSFIGWATYVVSIIQGTTKPHVVTRILLTLTSLLNIIGSFSVKAPTGVKAIALLFLFQSVTLLVLSLKFGVRYKSKLEYYCIALTLIGLLLWKISGNGFVALSFAVLADATAFTPTIVKTWKHPRSESPWFYLLEVGSFVIILSVSGMNAKSIFNIYLLVVCIVMLLLINRLKLKKLLEKSPINV